MIPPTVETFEPKEPLPCPDCQELGSKFYDHCLVGWLCEGCYERVKAACEGLARYKMPERKIA